MKLGKHGKCFSGFNLKDLMLGKEKTLPEMESLHKLHFKCNLHESVLL